MNKLLRLLYWQKQGYNSKIWCCLNLSVETSEIDRVVVKSIFCPECDHDKIKFKNNRGNY